MAKSLELFDQVPEINLSQVTGDTFSLTHSLSQKKDWFLIIFFRGSWCSVCVEDLKELENQKSYFEKKNVQLVTISTDQPSDLLKMKAEHNFSFPILHDDSLKALSDYGVKYHGEDAPYNDHGEHGEPAYFLIDEKGRLLYQQIQTSPFGRPTATELRKIIQYIKKNLK